MITNNEELSIVDTDDLTSLPAIDDDEILRVLERRYSRGIMFTRNGSMMISLNPCTRAHENSVDGPKVYASAAKASSTKSVQDLKVKVPRPHIYEVCVKAYLGVHWDRIPQVLIISGESGSGKTEACKEAVRMLTHLSRSADNSPTGNRVNDLEDRLVHSAPVLEVVGNCRTARNRNSSRFGKLIDVHFSPAGDISSCEVQSFLLEKSRVISHAQTESSFHIFYLILQSKSTDTNRIYISDLAAQPHFWNYLKPASNDEVAAPSQINSSSQTPHDAISACGFDLDAFSNALSLLGMESADIGSLIAMVVGVLHLGNIRYGGTEDASVLNYDQLQLACKQLGCCAQELTHACTSRHLRVGSDWVTQKLRPAEASAATHALSKGIYERIFLFVVSLVNAALRLPPPEGCIHTRASQSPATGSAGSESNPSVGLLDIFGFESFHVSYSLYVWM